MNYEIQIHDMENVNDPLIVHYAARNSISLEYQGGDEPDDPIVGSAAEFTLETRQGEDFKYGQYFTSNEKRYRVTWVIEETQKIVWRGFILPESFSEPYEDPLFYTSFSAVDGLGLLKGKQLDDSYYKDEKTVIQVITACLRLTEIDFDIYMAPAIHNTIQQNWNSIFMDMLRYEDEDKRPSAYDILEDVLSSKLCQIFQCEGRWYIEGFNRRNLPKAEFYKYDKNGAFLGTEVIEKNTKEIRHFIGVPSVSMVPALGRLTVSHEAPEVKVNTAVYQDADVEWVAAPGLDGSFYPREWLIYGDWTGYQENARLPIMDDPDYFLTLRWEQDDNQRQQNYLELRKKPYLQKNTRVRITLSARIVSAIGTLNTEEVKRNYDLGNFINNLIYRIKLNDRVLYYNVTGSGTDTHPMNLDAQGKGKLQLDFLTTEDGYLNIELWEPYKDLDNIPSPLYVIDELRVENMLQRENEVVSLIVDENSSVTKDVDLAISDDISANSNCFTLERIRDLDQTQKRTYEFPVHYGYTLNGEHYAVVSLKAAVMIEQYATEVYWNLFFSPVLNFEVVYNVNGTTEMALKTQELYTDGKFLVNVRPLAAPTTDRRDWLKWSDAVYGVEQKPYAEVVAEIYRRLFEVPRLKLDGSTDAPIKYNDLLKFRYNNEDRYFAMSNLVWEPDDNLSTFTAFEAFYEGVGVGNVPPYVDAGPDLELAAGETAVQITEAATNDPDGGVPTILWEQISGPAGAQISNPAALNPSITNLSGDAYEFQITATDESGNMATDTMIVTRPQEYLLAIDNFENTEFSGSIKTTTSKYRLVFYPELSEGSALILDFNAQVDMDIKKGYISGYFTRIEKNGSEVFYFGETFASFTGRQNFSQAGSIQYEPGADVVVTHYIWYTSDFKGTTENTLAFTAATFINSNGATLDTPYPIITKTFTK